MYHFIVIDDWQLHPTLPEPEMSAGQDHQVPSVLAPSVLAQKKPHRGIPHYLIEVIPAPGLPVLDRLNRHRHAQYLELSYNPYHPLNKTQLIAFFSPNYPTDCHLCNPQMQDSIWLDSEIIDLETLETIINNTIRKRLSNGQEGAMPCAQYL